MKLVGIKIKFSLLILALFYGIGSGAQTLELTADFETDGQNYTLNGSASGDFGRFHKDDENGEGGSDNHTSANPITNVQGDYYIFGDDLDGDVEILLSSVDLSSYNTLQVDLRLAAPATSYDDTDYIRIEYRIDGGSWQSLAQFHGEGSDTFFSQDLNPQDNVGDGDNRLNAALTENSFRIYDPGLTNDVEVRIQMNNSFDGEDFVIDNVRVYGETDVTAPTASAPTNTPQTLMGGVTSSSTIESTEFGDIYLVLTGEAASTQGEVNTAISGNNAFLGQGNAQANTPYTVTPLGTLNDGVYDIVAIDAAGNVSVIIAGWLTVDNTAPTITSATVTPDATTLAVGNVVTVTLTATGGETGLIEGPTLATINGEDVSGNFSDIGGGDYTFTYTVGEGDSDWASNTLTIDLGLEDAAGNEGRFTSLDANTLVGDANTPTVTSATVTPDATTVGVGDVVTVTLTASGSETGLIEGPTLATINGEDVSGNFSDIGGGDYTFTYTVGEGDSDWASNTLTIDLGLEDAAGNEGRFTSLDANTLIGDANTPSITNAAVTPDATTVGVGDAVTVTLTAGSSETGLAEGTTLATINGEDVSGNFSDIGGGDYTFTYTIGEGDSDWASNALTIDLGLEDAGGNEVRITSLDANTLVGDANTPTISSAVVTPDATTVGISSVVTVTLTAGGSEAGLSEGPTLVTINGEDVSGNFSDIGGGDYTFTYTIGEGDSDWASNALPIDLGLEDGAGNEVRVTSLDPNTLVGDANRPVISTIARSLPTAAITNSSSVTFRVTFNEDVSNVDMGDFLKAGTATGTLSGFNTISGTEYDLTISSISGNGTINLDINTGTQDITDLAGNAYDGTTISSEEEYTIDNDPPQATVSIDSDPIFIGDPTQVVTVTYDESMDPGSTPIINFSSSANFSGAAGSWSMTTFANDTWTQTFTHNGNPEEISAENVSVSNGSGATDIAGNADLGDTSADFLIDTQPPTLLTPQYFPNSGESNSNRDVLRVQVSEDITLSTGDALLINNSNTTDPGFHIEVDGTRVDFVTGTGSGDYSNGYNVYQNDGATRNGIPSIRSLRFEGSNNGQWDGTENPRISYVTGGPGSGRVFDLAGNEMATTLDNLSFDGDITPPEIQGDIVLFPNGTSAETIVINFNEIIDLADAAPVTGFSATNGIFSAVYDISANSVTLTSTNNGDWNLTTVVSYALGGNVLDATGNELQAISIDQFTTPALVYENIPPSLTALTVDSNNPATDLARGGNVVNIDFTTDDGLNAGSIVLSNVQSGGVAITDVAYVYGTIGVNQYRAAVDIAAADTDGLISFDLNFNDEAGNAVASTVTQADISSGPNVTVDNTLPRVNSITRTDANPHDAGINAGSVQFTVTFDEPVNNIDDSDFSASFSNLTAAPSIASVNPTSGTVFTVTVNGFDLQDAAASGTLNLNIVSTGTITDDAGNDNTNAAVLGADETYTIINPEPAEDIVSLTTPDQTNNTITLNWTNSVVDQIAYQHLILVKESGSFPNPSDGSFISNDLSLSTGTTDQMAINVTHGTNSFVVTGLNSGTDYDFEIYPYTNDGTNVDYKTSSPATLSSATIVASLSRITAISAVNSISSLIDTQAEAQAATPNFQFNIHDDGGITDDNVADNAKTEFTELVITQGPGNGVADWTTVIAGARLSGDEGNDLNSDDDPGQVDIQSDRIIFSGITHGGDDLGEVDDDEIKTYTLRIWFNAPMADGVDNLDMVFEIDAANITPVPGSSGYNPSFDNGNSTDGRNQIIVNATELNWTQQPPANVGVEANFSVAPVITAQDAVGNRDVDYIGTVSDVSNTGGITMNNNPDASGLAHSFTSGMYTFDISVGTGFSYQDAGDGTLTVISGALPASPTSDAVAVSYSDGTTISAGGAAEPATISSLTTVAAGAQAFDISIEDDANFSIANDQIPTRFNQITFNAANLSGSELIANWNDVLENAILFDGATIHFAYLDPDNPGFPNGGSIGTNSITFSSLEDTDPGDIGYIADEGTKTYFLYIWFKESVTNGLSETMDNQHFNFEIGGSDIVVESNSSTMDIVSSAINSGVGNNTIEVIATELGFHQQPPTEYLVNTDFGANAPIVEAIDIYENRDLDYAESVIVTDVAPSEVFINPPPASFSNGALVFPTNFQYTQVAASTQLNINPQTPVTPGPLPAINSNTFEIRVGRGTTITPGSNPEPATISSLETSDPGTFVFDFDVNDDAGSEDDGVATLIESMAITQGSGFNDPNFADWTDIIAGVEISDGTNQLNSNSNPGNITITASEIQFSGISTTVGALGYIGDDATKTYSLNIWLKDQIDYRISNDLINPPTLFADDKKLEFQIHEDDITTVLVGSSFQDNEFVESGDANAIDVEATDLKFVRQPVDGVSFAPFNAPQPRIAAIDASVNTDIDYAEPVLAFTNSLTLDMVNSPDPADLGQSFAAGVLELDVNFGFEEDGENLTFDISTAAGGGYGAFSKTSDQFIVNASEESSITFTSASVNIPYKDHLVPTNKFILGTFALTDGDGSTDDADEADTRLDQLEITITNPGYIDEVGLFDQSGTEVATIPTPGATETFTGFLIIAPDGLGSSVNFTVRANFNTSIIDNQSIELSITNASTAGGSKLDPGNTLPSVPPGNNVISVIATEYVFTQSPAAIEGVNVPLITLPEVQAQDINGVLDLDINEANGIATFEITAPAGASGALTFVNGISDLSNLTYGNTGDGTLTVTDNGSRGISSAFSNPVDVINTVVSELTDGVSTLEVLNTGAADVPIFGLQFAALTNTPSEPELNELTFQFRNTNGDAFAISNVYEDFRLFRSTDENIDLVNLTDEALINGLGVTVNAGSVTFTGLTEILDNDVANQNIFLVVDVALTAEQSATPTPLIETFITSADIVNSNGSTTLFNDVAELVGEDYTFEDQESPIIVTFSPEDGTALDPNNNVAIGTNLEITFNEPMTFTGAEVITLRKQNDIGFSQDVLVTSFSNGDKTFTFDPPSDLDENENYYIQIGGSEFSDLSDNNFAGINDATTWNFKTSDATPPIFVTPNPITTTNVYNQGFDLGVRIDEPGQVHYIIVEDSEPAPGNATEVFDNGAGYTGTIVESGIITITVGDEYHYEPIFSLSSNEDYVVYAVAQDNANPSPNRTVTFETKTESTTSGSGSNTVTVNDPEIEICQGDFQLMLQAITIREGDDDDFGNGNNQSLLLALPTGFEFKTLGSSASVRVSGSDIDNESLSFVNSSILRVTYDISSTGSDHAIIILEDIEIKATSPSASGSIVRIGGTADQDGNSESDNLSHAQLSVSTASNASFQFDPPASSVPLTSDPIQLVPTASLLIEGENIFSGTAVVGDNFHPSAAGLGTFDIELIHTTLQGCQLVGNEEITVFDDSEAIPFLQSKYCTSNTSLVVTIGENDKPGFRLTDLSVDPSSTANTSAVAQVGNDYTIDINLAGQSLDQETFVLKLEATYQSKTNSSVFETFPVEVQISDPPDMVLRLADGFTGPRNLLDFCVDGEEILLTGEYDTDNQPNGQSNFRFTEIGSSDPINDIIDFTASDNNASVTPQDIVDNLGFGDHEIAWELTNPNTTCTNNSNLTISVSELPVVDFAQNSACENLVTNFIDETTLPVDDTADNNATLWTWNFDDPGSADNVSDVQNSTHTFASTGFYDVSLEVTSEKGCTSTGVKSIQVGGIPNPTFNYTGVNIEDIFTFENDTDKPGTLTSDTVKTLTWNLGDGNEIPVERVSDADDMLTHEYASSFIDSVALTVTTSLGCEATLSQPIAVLQKFNAATAPANGFESGSEGWTTIDTNNNSWTLSNNNGDIDQAGNFMWVTNPNSSYLAAERSYVYSPTLDISDVSRPLVQFDAYWDLATGDGVILEYSTDNLNVADPNKAWTELGAIGTGEDWYDGDNLPSVPGGGTIDFGWAGSAGLMEPKHIFDSIPSADRDNLNLRFGLASVNAIPNKPGFAFDNLFIGSRTRTVLVENFTNTSRAGNTKSESDYLKSFSDTDLDGTVMIKINYHTDFPGKDPLNDANKVDPGARALYYDIEETPRAVIDGTITQDAPFSQWGSTEFNLRSLILAQYELAVNVTTNAGTISIEAIPTPQNNAVLSSNSIITAAILEKDVVLSEIGVQSVTSQETDFEFVLRKLLPNAAGRRLITDGAQSQVAMPPVNFSWIPYNVVDPSDMAVVVFIQDELTKEVYQSEIVLNVATPDQVTGLGDELTTSFNIYPNPANDKVTVTFEPNMAENNSLNIYDTFGKLVFSRAIDQTDQSTEVDTRDFAAGLYHVQMKGKNGLPIRKRLMIVKR